MEAYLDNSATTRCSQKASEQMMKVLREEFGNPSSLHQMGMNAEQYVKESREIISRILKVSEKEIIFTSGGTESNNLAIIGSAMANNRAGKHIITTSIEHASVNQPMEFLSQSGYEITYLSVDADGRISLEELKNAIRKDTILVSIMQVNNEIGTIEPVEAAAKIIKEKNPNCLFHVDAIQSFGKMNIYPKRMGIDMLSVSGHKIHGPKGSGFLYVRDKVKIKPIILGGGQEKGMRSGTENVPAIAGLGVACREIYASIDDNRRRLYSMRNYFIGKITQIDGVTVNGRADETFAPHIVSVSVKGVRSEVLLHSLEDRKVYVSAGSACSSNRPAVSRTLKSIKVPMDLLDSTVRFSFSVHTTMEEIDYACDIMSELIPMLQRYTRR